MIKSAANRILVLKTYCCEEELSSMWMTTWYTEYTGIICPKVSGELALCCCRSPHFWSCLVTCVRGDLGQGFTKELLHYLFAISQFTLSERSCFSFPYWLRQAKHSGTSILNQLPKAEQEHLQQRLFTAWCCFFLWLSYEAAFWFEWENKLVHCLSPSLSLGMQMLCPQGFIPD